MDSQKEKTFVQLKTIYIRIEYKTKARFEIKACFRFAVWAECFSASCVSHKLLLLSTDPTLGGTDPSTCFLKAPFPPPLHGFDRMIITRKEHRIKALGAFAGLPVRMRKCVRRLLRSPLPGARPPQRQTGAPAPVPRFPEFAGLAKHSPE